MRPGGEAAVTRVTAKAYSIPTDAPESDGTIAWDSTTMVIAEVEAGGETGLGYTYCDKAAAERDRGRAREGAPGQGRHWRPKPAGRR